MAGKFRNKYRINTARMQHWDYGWNAAYFVTICTANRECYFGEIVHKEMHLSEIGELANTFWSEIHKHFPFVVMDAFVVMPNHVNGILIIDKHNDGRNNGSGRDKAMPCLYGTGKSLNPELTPGQKRFQNQGKNTLSSIIGSYKSIVTRYARQIHADFAWESLFHDHIIRNDRSLYKIRQYITGNPLKWSEDILNPYKE